jgi:mono/diheme cytochrome c family protein
MTSLSTAPSRARTQRRRGTLQRLVYAAAMTLPFLLAGGAAKAQDEPAPRAAFGRLTYQLSCAVCHGPSGHGDGQLAGALVVPAPDLTRLARRNGGPFPRERVRAIIEGGSMQAEHGGQMPAWGLIFLKDFASEGPPRDARSIVRQRIEDLVVYLESIQE